MYKHKSLLTLFLLPCILLSLQCKRPDCSKDVPITLMIPQEILDYVDFKAGSYWVFQDSATGRIDSEVVLSSKHTMENVDAYNKCQEIATMRRFENIEINFRRYDSLGTLTGGWLREFDNGPKYRNRSLDKFFVINNGGNSFVIGYPFDEIYGENSYEIHESKLDSILLNGKMYYNVIEVLELFQAKTDFVIYSYFAKNIGLIQRGTKGLHQNDYSKSDLIRFQIK